MRLPVFVLSLVLAGATAVPANASSITFEDAGITGLSITLTNQFLVSGTTSTYNILLSVDTTSSYSNEGDPLAPDLLTAISFDLSGSNVTAVLDSYSGGTGTSWSLVQNTQVNNGGGDCQGTSAGQPCIQETQSVSLAGNLVLTPTVANYWWLFRVNLQGGSFSDSTSVQAFIMDLERNCQTGRGGVTTCDGYKGLKKAEVFSDTEAESLALAGSSEDPVVAPVPEPGSLVLLGSGLVFAASRMRRRR